MSNPVDPRQPLIDLENKKFRQGFDADDIGVKVFGEFTAVSGTHPLDSVQWDSYQVTRNSLEDIVEYYQGGLLGTLVITFTATFEDTRKKKLLSGVWVRP